jgi:Txe/YoeB family toxin of Txe-Axe toxin-antitoxin module
MSKKAKTRTKINPILGAAIEDAFDECKNPDELSEHSKKGTKADYTYPKQKNKKLKIKLPSKKQKSILKKQ